MEKENWKEVFRTNRINCSDVDLRASLIMQNIKFLRYLCNIICAGEKIYGIFYAIKIWAIRINRS